MEEINTCINCPNEPDTIIVVAWYSRVFMRFGVCHAHEKEAIAIVCDTNNWPYRKEPVPPKKDPSNVSRIYPPTPDRRS